MPVHEKGHGGTAPMLHSLGTRGNPLFLKHDNTNILKNITSISWTRKYNDYSENAVNA